MLIAGLILIPLLAGAAAFAIKADRARRALLVATALAHAALTAVCLVRPPAPALGGWLVLDALGLVFLMVTSGLFLAAAVYGAGYLARETAHKRDKTEESFLFDNQPEAVFTGCLLLFLGTMTLVTASHNFTIIWVAVEATTLVTAPLIYFHRRRSSLEATWKYLLICSVGIALALLGTFFLAVSASAVKGQSVPLVLDNLLRAGPALDPRWLKAAFLLLVVGYGTKMGLAPLHTWLPDAHSQAPSMVSALLSGALLNCAFLAVLRGLQVCTAAGQGPFAQDVLVALGLVSMGVAAALIIGQADYKRMLAYSSVEHMGLLAVGVGLGGAANFGAMLHVLNHSLTKGFLFFIAGNILAAYKTKSTAETSGLLRVRPASAVLWLAGFLAISGSPPFGPFMSEFSILKAAFEQGSAATAVIVLVLLVVAFIGMAGIVLRMTFGTPGVKFPATPAREPLSAVLPPAVLAAAVLALGLYVPPALSSLLRDAARLLGGS